MTLGTFCYRDSHLLIGGGSFIFVTEGEVLNPTPPPPHTHTHKASRKNSTPLWQNILKPLTPTPSPPAIYANITDIWWSNFAFWSCWILVYSFDKPKHKLYINIFYYYLHCASNGYQIWWGTIMFGPLDEDKKKENYDPWWFTVNISQYIIIYFYENDTNEAKGSYHDDCLEKKNEKKKKQKKTTYFAYWTGAWWLAAPEI